jgi:uncharacterized protein (TIGR02466 family)
MVERTLHSGGTKMIKRFPIISADIFHKNVGTKAQRDDIIRQAWEERQRNDKTISWTNRGCWRTYLKYENIDWLMTEIRELLTEAGNYYQQVDPIYTRKAKSFTGSQMSYWTNMNSPGGRNAMHDHKLWHYVACYYLQATGTGDIVYFNPMNLTEGCNPYAPFVSPVAISPQDGDLLLWPAWLPHEVETNNSNKERINIAINMRFDAPISLEDVQYAGN